ncbi:hypothetical protein MA16_Dca025032 [Dendrobium catenatum]|uniref:Uncharacterized protein n=1 Tax=Dendrobium catenatum TaxID=906689 RepID=A0A2I0V9M8_9ASPA|nr:hypothetical protein MA16_Dca025032 [Dendrobium catenatum]
MRVSEMALVVKENVELGLNSNVSADGDVLEEGKMTGKLIFSMSDNMNLSYNPFADGSIIKFGKGFEELQLSDSGPEFTIIPPSEVANQKPILEFTLGCGSKIAPVTPKASVFTRIEQPSQDQKLMSIVVVDNSVPFSAPSKFEIGSSSNLSAIMTKTQRRNKNHCIKRRMEKLGMSKKNEIIPPTSPHLRGSKFRLLSTADGEKDARLIARSTPTTVRKSTTEPIKSKETHIQNLVKVIVQDCADGPPHTREEFLRKMRRLITDRIEEETLRKKLIETRVGGQSRARVHKRKFKPTAISALTDGYAREPRRSSRKTNSIVFTDASVKFKSTQHVPQKVNC